MRSGGRINGCNHCKRSLSALSYGEVEPTDQRRGHSSVGQLVPLGSTRAARQRTGLRLAAPARSSAGMLRSLREALQPGTHSACQRTRWTMRKRTGTDFYSTVEPGLTQASPDPIRRHGSKTSFCFSRPLRPPSAPWMMRTYGGDLGPKHQSSGTMIIPIRADLCGRAILPQSGSPLCRPEQARSPSFKGRACTHVFPGLHPDGLTTVRSGDQRKVRSPRLPCRMKGRS